MQATCTLTLPQSPRHFNRGTLIPDIIGLCSEMSMNNPLLLQVLPHLIAGTLVFMILHPAGPCKNVWFYKKVPLVQFWQTYHLGKCIKMFLSVRVHLCAHVFWRECMCVRVSVFVKDVILLLLLPNSHTQPVPSDKPKSDMHTHKDTHIHAQT